jgi:hypothetical protein
MKTGNDNPVGGGTPGENTFFLKALNPVPGRWEKNFPEDRGENGLR